jgi:hypothetical protein
MCSREHAYHDEYADPYCDSNAYEYQHPNINSLTHPYRNRDTTDLSMGEFHECRCGCL